MDDRNIRRGATGQILSTGFSDDDILLVDQLTTWRKGHAGFKRHDHTGLENILIIRM